MAPAEQEEGRIPDLYQLLGVPRGASGGEITRAWRRRAAAEHPDRRGRDPAAPARFLALANAYEVLGDPARRAAYDRSLGNQPRPGAAAGEGPAAGAAGKPIHRTAVPVTVRQAGRVPAPPLRAGPVWAEVAPSAPAAGWRMADADLVRLDALVELAVRRLAADWGRPW